jgi:hypothetical protein
MNALLEDEEEADKEFWNQDAFADRGTYACSSERNDRHAFFTLCELSCYDFRSRKYTLLVIR